MKIIKAGFIELFCNLAKKYSEKIAILNSNSFLTYAELDQKSDLLAEELQKYHPAKGDLIGLYTKKKQDIVVAILATWKVKGGYLLLDPSSPKNRLKAAFDSLDSVYTLKQNNIELDSIDFQGSSIFITPNRNESLINKSDEATSAYGIFTSGTSGPPKLASIEHQSILNTVLGRKSFYPKGSKVPLFGALGFDMSLMIILHTLLSGGTLYIPEPHVEKNVETTIQYLEEHSIDFLLTVPSFYSSILQKAKSLPSLKQVVLGGEVLPPSLVKLHEEKAPQAALNNEYGPTECAICTTVAKVYDPIKGRAPQVTIGKPIDNMQVHILDENFVPVPQGKKGILFISGVGVARGYLNNPELTKQKFLEINIEGKKTRVFRTGDYGRYLENGEIEFLGRIDNQVKIRGYRIELGEVESALTNHPDVIDGVIVDQELNGLKKLVCFYQGNASSRDLLKHLSNDIPDYMVPSKFLRLDQFPLTHNGKIDRKALRSKCTQTTCSGKAVDPSDIEGALLSIWKKILDHDSISPKDNFFDVGGDSLSVIELQESISKTFGRDVPLTDLFQYPSIDQFTQYLQKQSPTSIEKPLSSAKKKKAVFQKLRKKRG